MYKNSEGYSDPTAGAAMSRVMKEFRQEQKNKWNRQYEMKHRPKVYIVSKYAGDIEKNVENAVCYCRYAIRCGKMPIASHLLYPAVCRDHIPKERELGMMFGLALLAMCDEVYVFGKDISPGMVQEIQEAKRLGKAIRYFDEEVR